jgi:Reverse transcriptase (RNA-dependent DNA polymerase)
MEGAKNHSPSGYPVFVAWRTVYEDGKPDRKGRVVVDIRDLNKISVPDIYPTPIQSDILAGKKYITVVDAMPFFYQWRVHPEDRNRLTVVSHRGQEVFNVAVMDYMNSVAYVQSQLNNKLRDFRAFARAYVDDIIIFSNSLEDHLIRLDEVLGRLNGLNIHLSPGKAFISFHSVTFLGVRVDSLGLTTAIANLKSPQTLQQLETYLGLTGWTATIGIAKQTSLSTTSTDKLNLRLIQAALYVQQFHLELYHKPGKTNVVPDALSRLPSSDAEQAPDIPILLASINYHSRIDNIEES